MQLIPVVLGSVLMFAGRVAGLCPLPASLPRWWTYVGEPLVAAVPALLALYGPGWAGWLWLLLSISLIAMGLWWNKASHSFDGHLMASPRLSDPATLCSTPTEPDDDCDDQAVLGELSRLAEHDPEVHDLMERLGVGRV